MGHIAATWQNYIGLYAYCACIQGRLRQSHSQYTTTYLPSYLMLPSRSSSVPVYFNIWSTSVSLSRSPFIWFEHNHNNLTFLYVSTSILVHTMYTEYEELVFTGSSPIVRVTYFLIDVTSSVHPDNEPRGDRSISLFAIFSSNVFSPYPINFSFIVTIVVWNCDA